MKHVKFIIHGRYGKVSIIKKINELASGQFSENVFDITVTINCVSYRITGAKGADGINLDSVYCFEIDDDFVSQSLTPIEAIYVE